MEITTSAFIVTLITAIAGFLLSIYTITELSIEKKQRKTVIENLVDEIIRLREIVEKYEKDFSNLS